MKLSFNVTHYYDHNKKISKFHGMLFMILGFIILGFVSYGLFQLSNDFGSIYENWNSDSSSDSNNDYSYKSPYNQVYDDCLAECINDYGTTEGNYKNDPSQKITVSVTKIPNENYICECMDSTNNDGWTMEYSQN